MSASKRYLSEPALDGAGSAPSSAGPRRPRKRQIIDVDDAPQDTEHYKVQWNRAIIPSDVKSEQVDGSDIPSFSSPSRPAEHYLANPTTACAGSDACPAGRGHGEVKAFATQADAMSTTMAKLRDISLQSQDLERKREERILHARMLEERALRGEKTLGQMLQELIKLQRGVELKRKQIEEDKAQSRQEHELAQRLTQEIEENRRSADGMLQEATGGASSRLGIRRNEE